MTPSSEAGQGSEPGAPLKGHPAGAHSPLGLCRVPPWEQQGAAGGESATVTVQGDTWQRLTGSKASVQE